MRVENYRCSEDQIEEMAGDHYWFFMRGMPSSEWSGRPTSTMDPHRPSASKDWSASSSSDMYSHSEWFDKSSDMYSHSDWFDKSSDMYSGSSQLGKSTVAYSSSDVFDKASDIYGSSDHPMYSSDLHGSKSDDIYQSTHPTYGDHSSSHDMSGTDYMNSLPFICKGEFCAFFHMN